MMIAGTEEQGVETPEEHAFYIKMMEDSKRRLQAMKNKYAGEDCFVIGMGPSLLKTDFSLIKDKYLFGVNDLYRSFKQFNIQPQFYGISDGGFLPKYGDDVLKLNTQLFLTRSVEIQYLRNYDYYHTIVKREPILLCSLLPEMTPPNPNEPYEKGSNKFSKDASDGIYSGWSVIIDVCLHITYYLGFSRVILIGCDCNYSKAIYNPNICIEVEDTALAPEWVHCFKICKTAFEEDGRKIFNATAGDSKLYVFPRMKLEDITK